MSTPLIVVSSRTGNTQKIADALHGAIPSAKMVRAEELPEDLSDFNPVFLGFWCDRGMAPEDMKAVAPKLKGKRIGVFATMGAEPSEPNSQAWAKKTSEALTAAGENNTLCATFLCQGRVDPEVFRRVTEMMGGLTPEREARRLRAESHPDAEDDRKCIETFFKAGLIEA